MSEIDVTPAAGVWSQAFRRAFASRPFVVAVVIMALAAFGMGAAQSFLKLRFRKTPVALQHPLEKVPQQLGNWVQISTDEPLEGEIEHALGTKTYIFRDYADKRVAGDMEIKEILNASNTQERRMLTAKLEGHKPHAIIHAAVTYYTGMVDTVAHVPDRCYVADGYTPQDPETKTWKLTGGEALDVRFINFEDATGFSSRVSKNVAYFFQVNGEMESSPLAVRYRLQDLTKADVYYAKIEVMSLVKQRKDVERVMTDFLSEAMPEIRKCLPARTVAAGAAPAATTTRGVEQ